MTHNERLPPIENFIDLNRVSDAGYGGAIKLGVEDRKKVAEWAGLPGVDRFEARISVARLGPTRFAYKAHVEAEIRQTCTVSLVPVFNQIDLDFTRDLHVVAKLSRAVDFSSELTAAAGDDEVPEEIDNTNFDLAAPVMEEFLLAIDPYPRAPGAHFDAPQEKADAPESPFAVLKSLKSKT